MSNFYSDADEAVEELKKLRPSMTPQSAKYNRTKIKSHLDRDYSNGRGLRKLGIGGNRTKNWVEFYANIERDRIEIEYMVAVEVDGEFIGFAFDEALGYNSFILTRDEIDERSQAEKQKHLTEKANEEYNEQH